MENLSSTELIGCLVAFLTVTLSMLAAKARRGGRKPHDPGAEAAVYRSPREWRPQARSAPAHGKERTPC